MLGRQSDVNQSVYYYDFFELSCSRTYKAEHAAIFHLLKNPTEFLRGNDAVLLIRNYRKPVSQLPIFASESTYNVHKAAIVQCEDTMQLWAQLK
jgi:hypothetical protein